MLEKALSIASNLATVAATVLAFYLFFAKGSEIRTMLRAVANFAHQSSLGEIRQKLDLIASLRTQDDQDEIVSIFHDICGQIDGNPRLKGHFAKLTDRVRRASGSKRTLTEPLKRSLVSELRETLKHSDVLNIADAMGDKEK